MQKRLMFIAGAGLGFVLGARAGRGRYEQIKAQADTVWHDPRVQDKVQQAQTKVTETVQEKAPVVQEKAQQLASTAQAKVTEKVQEAAPVVQEKAQTLASAVQDKAGDAAATVRQKVSKDHSGNQIGVESSSDVEPHEVKFESGK